MARVTIVNENASFEVPDGARLLEYARANSNMPFGCENGKCGTCICNVLRGMENLTPKGHEEWLHLQKRGAFPNQRLACQIWVKKGEVDIEY
jgi:ferredoxin